MKQIVQDTSISNLQQIHTAEAKKAGVELWIKRDDLIHLYVSGNKWRKLKYNLIKAHEEGFKKLLTFGGAFSNHIAAVASAGKLFDFETLGIIRGEEVENPTLNQAKADGMRLKFVDRQMYKTYREYNYEKISHTYNDYYLIPEGGTNQLALKGVAELVKETGAGFTHMCVACGTGGTMAGLLEGAFPGQIVIGFPALKGNFMEEEVLKLSANFQNQGLMQEKYHFGGYAKWTDELLSFIRSFYYGHGIKLDAIYTGKMMYGVMDLITNGYFDNGSKIVCIHTGGMQGMDGFEKRFNIRLFDQD